MTNPIRWALGILSGKHPQYIKGWNDCHKQMAEEIVRQDKQIDELKKDMREMVEAYGDMEKGIDDPILCHYNGTRLHNAMEDLRALVIPGYAPDYEPKPECLIDNGAETPAGEVFFNTHH